MIRTAPPTTFDVFMSHNSRDKPAVERLSEKLKREGMEPWLDKWCLTPGGNWQIELHEGLQASKACAFFVGPHGHGDWAREELHVALDRAAKDRDFRLFLVLLPGLPEPFDPSTLPPFLSTRTWVDLRKGLEDTRSFRAFVHAILGIPLGPDAPIGAIDDAECPYRGLQAFDEAHAEMFFGRDADIQRLIEKLKTTRFLAVLGPSGSGKSSLVRAGLIPALREGQLEGSQDWKIRVMMPGALPLTNLAAQLAHLSSHAAMQQTLDQLAADARTLHLTASLAFADQAPTQRLVLVVDQFEELFTLCEDETERSQFLANLIYAATIPDGRCLVILTMRADFYHKCADYPDVSARVSAHHFLVSMMDPDGLRQAIEEPARRVGLQFEQGLVGTILNDVGSQPGSLPLLEHALMELWERQQAGMLTLEGYRESGGVHGAIAKRAEALFGHLSEEEQLVVRRSMLRMIHSGEGTQDTRRRATIREIVTRAEEQPLVERVIRDLADARLVITSRDPQSGENLVEIAHEALIRSWPRLTSWIEENRAALQVHRRLAEAALEWQRLQRDEGLLYRGARLNEVVEWRQENEAELNDLEREFIDASVALRERERLARERNRRIVTSVSLVAIALLMSIAAVALVQWKRAEDERVLAFARQLAARAEVLRTGQDSLLPHSVLLAVEALDRQQPLFDAERTLRNALGSLARPVATLAAQTPSHTVLFSPEGRLVATIGEDRSAQIWEPGSGKSVARAAHDDQVLAAAFSPDGQYLATASLDRTARIWESITGRELLRIEHGDASVFRVAFSPNGRLLATSSGSRGGVERVVRVWDLGTRQEVARLPHPNLIYGLSFSPDSQLLATAGEDRIARIWELSSGEELVQLPHDEPSFLGTVNGVTALAFSPDGRYLLTGSADRTARLWETMTGRELLRLPHLQPVSHVAFNSDGQYLATASADRLAHVWQTGTGQEIARLAHEQSITSLSFSSDGRYIATSGADHVARVWGATTGRELFRMPHRGPVLGSVFAPDARTVATVSQDGTGQLWDLRHLRELGRFIKGPGATAEPYSGVVGVAVTPDNRSLLTLRADGLLRLWDIATGQEMRQLRQEQRVTRLRMSPDGRYATTAGVAHTHRVWEIHTGQVLGELTHQGQVRAVAFSADSRFVATASEDRTARLWESNTGRQVGLFQHEAEVVDVVVSPDGRMVVTASHDRTARVWDAVTGREIARLSHPQAVFSVVFSPDSRLVGTAANDRTVRIWEAATGRELAKLLHPDDLSVGALEPAISFSPDGKLLATGSEDGGVRLWDVASGREVRIMRHDREVLVVRFSPDGRFLATASNDATGRLWVVATGEEALRMPHELDVLAVGFSLDGHLVISGSDDGTARIWQSGGENLRARACGSVIRNFTVEEWQELIPNEPYRATCGNLLGAPAAPLK